MPFGETDKFILPDALIEEHLVPAVTSIAHELGVTEEQALAICVFALVEQLNPNPNNEPTEIRVRNSGDTGVIRMNRSSDRHIQIQDTSRIPRAL
ncbi:MAG TPA: hypothetical protein VIH90_03785 [Candidatus Saccharimonadales bacterium]